MRGWKKVQELTDSYGEMPPEQEAKNIGEHGILTDSYEDSRCIVCKKNLWSNT